MQNLIVTLSEFVIVFVLINMFVDISDGNSLFELSVTSMWNPVAMFKILNRGGEVACCVHFKFVTPIKFSQQWIKITISLKTFIVVRIIKICILFFLLCRKSQLIEPVMRDEFDGLDQLLDFNVYKLINKHISWLFKKDHKLKNRLVLKKLYFWLMISLHYK